MKIFIVDNASYGVSEQHRWLSVIEDLKSVKCISAVFHIKGKSNFHRYHAANKYQAIDALSNELMFHLKTTVDDDSIFIFANARDALVLSLNEYRIFTKKKFKMYGYWVDSIHLTQGILFKRADKPHLTWIKSFEKCIIDALDLNMVPYDLLHNRMLKTYSDRVCKKITKCPLPFNSTIQQVISETKTLEIPREDIIVLNTGPEDIMDATLFRAITKEFPTYEFINIADKSLTPIEYMRLLSRAKSVISLNKADDDPYTIVESMALGCIPILPDIEIYKEMFHSDWIYSSIIFKLPYLNFIRNREEIFSKITNCVENYDNFNVKEKCDVIIDKYYNSDSLKRLLCNQGTL
jgi:hypothetical protein